MKIGIDASRANRLLRTGTEWYSFHLIKELALIDQKNKYLLYLDKEPVDDLKKVVENNKNFKFKILKWPWSYFWTLGRLSLEMVFRSPDVLFVPAHGLPFFSPKKTITTIHDIAFIKDKKIYRQEKIRSNRLILVKTARLLVRIFTLGKFRANSLDYLKWSTKRSLKKAKSIIAVSNFTKKEIIDYYTFIKEDKIKVIHNGYNQSIYKVIGNKDKTNEVLNKYGFAVPFFLYVGRLEKKKNTPKLLEAFSILKEDYPNWPIRLALVGNASFGYDEVKYIIENFNLSPYIDIPGWIEDEDMPYVYNSALALIFPSQYEGFGIPVLEAMASGTPTAVSNLAVLREVAQEASLFFNQDSPREIADAMIRLYKEEELRNDLKNKGLKRSKYFSWQKTAQETLSLIESL
jgi:glycosyltransferase involved in cell wall biosynthesis